MSAIDKDLVASINMIIEACADQIGCDECQLYDYCIENFHTEPEKWKTLE